MPIKRNFLICLVGLPASGKTTYAKSFKEYFKQNYLDFKVKIIDPDLIRNIIIPKGFNHNKEKLVRKKNLKEIKKALKNRQIVISDDLNYYTSMRHDLKEIAKKFNIDFFIIHISTPYEVCLTWNELRGKTIPNIVINNIKDKFDDFRKYNWDNPIKIFDMSKTKNVDDIISDSINYIIQYQESKVEKNKEKQSIDKLNQVSYDLDKITRKIVGDLLKLPQFQKYKDEIITHRKLFIKENFKKSLRKTQISDLFKKYLETSLNLKIS